MFVSLKDISPLVKRQFPSFYLEEGGNFLQFIKAYYEWMEEEGGATFKARRLGEFTDVDETLDEYVKYFMNKYMHGMPQNILADKKLLIKHIKDFYSSKGSIENIKLLFRILYNMDVKIYLPQVDMLRASDGKWIRRKFLEVKPSLYHYDYIGKYITGTTSGATAYVEDAIRLNISNQPIYILYISNLINGPTGRSFIVDEHVVYDGLSVYNADKILGSAVGADVISSSENFSIGDVLVSDDTTGKNLKFNVSKLFDSNLSKGYITFRLIDGGEGYTVNSDITISYLTATTGYGAGFKIGSIVNPYTFLHNDLPIEPETDKIISALDYGANLNNAAISTVLEDALEFNSITVGTIGSLTARTSGDRNYNGSLRVNVNEPLTYGYKWVGKNGGFWGNNAIISALPSTGNGVIQSVRLLSSGYGYNTQGELLDFYCESNTQLQANLSIIIDGVGSEEGFWLDESGFISDNKYIQDSWYYQEYSYEIQIEKSLNKYVDVVKKLSHPVGNRLFGKPLIIDVITDSEVSLVEERVRGGVWGANLNNPNYPYLALVNGGINIKEER